MKVSVEAPEVKHSKNHSDSASLESSSTQSRPVRKPWVSESPARLSQGSRHEDREVNAEFRREQRHSGRLTNEDEGPRSC